MPGERDAAVLDGAGVEKVNQQALALAHADGIARPERLVVDGVGHGADFQTVGIGVDGRRLFQQRAVVGVVVHVVHGAGEERLPVAQGQEKLLVVVAGVVAAVHVDEAELAGVGALVQVVHGHGVGVIPAAAGRAGRELEAVAAVRRHQGRAFLLGAVHLGRDQHAVPVDQFRRVGVVDDLHGDRLAFPHAQHRAWCNSVVADGGEDVGAVELDGDRRDAQGVVGLGVGAGAAGGLPGRASGSRPRPGLRQRHAAELQEIAPVHFVPLMHPV